MTRKVRLHKIGKVESGAPPIDKKNHIPGTIQDLNYSLPIEYTIEGDLLWPFEVNNNIHIVRTHRNGIESAGRFSSSKIKTITSDTITTENSIYKYEYL
jgi:hypothetical protein